MQFHYQCSTKRGKIKTGLIEAGSEFEAKKALEAKNLFAINLKPFQSLRLNFFIFPRRLRTLDLLVLTKNLSVLLKSGLTLTESLEIIIDQSGGRFKKIIAKTTERVKSGVSLATALEESDYFPSLYVNLIRSGESSGTLEENLDYLLDQLNNEYQLQKNIVSMMIYPLVILSLSFIIGLGVAIFVLPKITVLFVGLKIELPLFTRILLSIAHLFKNYPAQLIFGIIFGFILLVLILKQNFIKPLSHRIILNLPVIGSISRNLNLSRIFRTFGLLLKSGLTIDRSLEIVSQVIPNYLYKNKIQEIVLQVVRGQDLAEVLARNEKLFPKMTIKSIGAAEKSGALESTLFFLAKFYEEESKEKIKILSTFIEIGLLLFIGLVVLMLALSILMPIYQITGEISKF